MVAAHYNPNSPQARFYLGRLHCESADYLKARDDFIES
jgi:hypothetical protein